MQEMESPGRRHPGKLEKGFSLIELMAAVIIMGMLAGIVGVAVFRQLDTARVNAARTQIKQLESALAFYQMENGRFPTTEQGLDALVHKPSVAPEPRNYRPGGYLEKGQVPLDPWSNPYQYRYPGQKNPYSFDLWSLGADNAPGGEGTSRDIGNWTEAVEQR